jgi:hypothetical protein
MRVQLPYSIGQLVILDDILSIIRSIAIQGEANNYTVILDIYNFKQPKKVRLNYAATQNKNTDNRNSNKLHNPTNRPHPKNSPQRTG